MAFVLINIGSNLGDRRLHLSRAMRAVGEEFGPFEISHVVESDPWGFDSTHSFLNLGMMFTSFLEPEEILRRLQAIERSISDKPHRNPDGSYADRLIDIDIVAIDDMEISTDRLTVPHPRLAQREFFLRPLAELAPAWRHPSTGLTPAEMLSKILSENKDE